MIQEIIRNVYRQLMDGEARDRGDQRREGLEETGRQRMTRGEEVQQLSFRGV